MFAKAWNGDPKSGLNKPSERLGVWGMLSDSQSDDDDMEESSDIEEIDDSSQSNNESSDSEWSNSSSPEGSCNIDIEENI